MSKNLAQFDADDKVGLMPIINALVKPPDSVDSQKTLPKRSYQYYRKSGRGHNNDLCHFCSEGGDLICCDRCPSSFHLGCHDPPLDEDEIPNGIWICNKCKMKDTTEMLNSDNIFFTENKTKTNNPRKNASTKEDDTVRTNHSLDLNIMSTLTPLDHLIRAARILNPRQFELPRNISTYFPFPGTEKPELSPKTTAGKRGTRNRKLYELDVQGLVPLPAKTCHTCGKSCRKAPLISCDYCELFFHQDCIDPPLTALPTAMWMCPNHVEQFVDWKLINSVSATERIKLWNKFNCSIDQEAVKHEFFRKIHRRNPPFRFKQKVKHRGRLTIPSAVKLHYKHKASLLPSLRDLLRGKQSFHANEIPNKTYHDVDILSLVDNELKAISDAADKIQSTSDKTNSMDSNKSTSEVMQPGNFHRTINKQQCVANIHHQEECHKLKVTDHLKHLDESIIHKLALERLHQIIVMQIDKGKPGKSDASDEITVGSRQNEYDAFINLPSQLITKDDIERIARDFTSPKRENSTIEEISLPAFKESETSTGDEKHNLKKLLNFENLSLLNLEIRIRAVISPYDESLYHETRIDYSRSIFMRYRTMSIGNGSRCEVLLPIYGKCSYVSEKHAVIFFDEVTKMFELINYSEYGTEVNGQLFTCEFPNIKAMSYKQLMENCSSPLKKIKKDETTNFIAHKKREIINVRSNEYIDPSNPSGLHSMSSISKVKCNCICKAGNTSGWEGTAVLYQGAHIKFGCQSFIFTITDFDMNQTELDDTEEEDFDGEN